MISWLPPELLAPPGKLGVSRTPGSAGRPRDVDLDGFLAAGVDTVYCLQQEHEFGLLPEPETLEERAAAVQSRGMRFVHAPIVDMDVPSPDRLAAMVDEVQSELAAQRTIVVHCWAGLGRAGTVVACTLVARGLTAQLAVARLRSLRPGAVQSLVQERAIRAFAARLRQVD